MYGKRVVVLRQVVRLNNGVCRHAMCLLVRRQSGRGDSFYTIIIVEEKNVPSDWVIYQSTNTVNDARLGPGVASQK